MSSSLRTASSLASIAGTGAEPKLRKHLDFPTGSCGVCLPALSRRTGTMATDGQPAHATLATIASSRKPTRALSHPPTSGRAAIDVARAKSPTRRFLTRTAATAGCLHRLHVTPKTLSSPVSNVFAARESLVFRPSIRSAKSRRADRAGPPPGRSPPVAHPQTSLRYLRYLRKPLARILRRTAAPVTAISLRTARIPVAAGTRGLPSGRRSAWIRIPAIARNKGGKLSNE